MFCGKCGTKANEGNTFCTSCGTELVTTFSEENPSNEFSRPVAMNTPCFQEQQPVPRLDIDNTDDANGRKKKRNVVLVVTGIVVAAAVTLSVFYITRPDESDNGRKEGGNPVSTEELEEGINTGRYEGKGYNTSEEAVIAYANAFFNADIDGIIRACAVETYVENYDSIAYLKLGSVFLAGNDYIWSAFSGFDEQFAAEAYAGELALQFQRQYMGLCLSDIPEFDGIAYIREQRGRIVFEEEFAQELLESMRQNYTTDKLQAIDNYALLTVEEYGGDAYALYVDEYRSEFLKSFTSIRGVDESADFVVLFDMGRDKWAFSIGAFRYGDKWHAHWYSHFSYLIDSWQYYGIARVSDLAYAPSGTGGKIVEVAHRATATGQQIEGSGAKTPEMAVAGFMEGFTGADIGKMMEVSAVETYVENYDFLAIRHMTYVDTFILEPTVPFNTLSFRLSAMVRAKAISDRIQLQYILLLTRLMEDYGNTPFRFTEEKEAENFYDDLMRDFDADRLKSISDYEILASHDYNWEFYGQYIDNNDPDIQRILEMRGADEYADFVVSFSFEGEDWLMLFGVFKYKDRWFVEPGYSYYGLGYGVGVGPIRAQDFY